MKISKLLFVVFGAINIVYGIFAPITLSLLVVTVFNLSKFNQIVLLVVGLIATLYRAINFFRFKD